MQVEWVTATDEIKSDLAGVLLRAMRQSLEDSALDPLRTRDHFLQTLRPHDATVMQLSGRIAGFYVLRRRDTDLYLDHLYVDPDLQRQGLGACALARVLALSDAHQLDVRLRALRLSDATRFYERHGFTREYEGETDIQYVRRCSLAAPGGLKGSAACCPARSEGAEPWWGRIVRT
ncbi:GNAT family N-acetyltransferase [Roseateles amylovorans]|uniref:GNAT family N-acetyltransferase n=1 Tax=Roseateles amylovorans TaxID=2978473 RepID=A0ABY6AZZ7_9BURK|nr:GNAT family N-acetyltransferase [Roseateles amylovorans]UXH78370.1 GNAT family N-acetyltransferase [Roseateles amylovorans]